MFVPTRDILSNLIASNENDCSGPLILVRLLRSQFSLILFEGAAVVVGVGIISCSQQEPRLRRRVIAVLSGVLVGKDMVVHPSVGIGDKLYRAGAREGNGVQLATSDESQPLSISASAERWGLLNSVLWHDTLSPGVRGGESCESRAWPSILPSLR